jgi:hypothetical protein
MKYNILLKSAFAAMMLPVLIACSSASRNKPLSASGKGYVEISRANSSYFQFSDGSPYIPVGLNMISPGGKYRNDPDSALWEMGQWMKKLSDNGGNYIRIWLSSPFWDIEDQKAGQYSVEKAARIDKLLAMAAMYNIRVKMTFEHFRSLTMEENPQSWAVKSVYHTSNGGPLDSIRQYIATEKGRKLFTDKLDFYKERYGSDKTVFGWELWNEMNAVKGPQDDVFISWNRQMLDETKKRFPDNLVMQSLGSFDADRVRPLYREVMLMPGNQVAQVHRYLDLGASLETCHMPMDIICASAIDEIRSYNPGKPVILAETGAVEPRHSGPSKFYPVDTAGIILHDILFAPFFSGAAGAGMSWHWDSYVEKNNLWYHYGRFSEAIKGINPSEEGFVPSKSETDEFRIYLLQGRKTILLWLRDKNNSWQTELRDHQSPVVRSGIQLDLKKAGIEGSVGDVAFYDPWQNKWNEGKTDDMKLLLPDFRRSLVIRIMKR